MKVLMKSEGPISMFEVYQVVLDELSRIPLKESNLTKDQLRRKFCYLAVLEQIEHHSIIPSTSDLNIPQERIKILDINNIGSSAKQKIQKNKIEKLLDKLHSEFGLSQAELLQIIDLARLELVDLYAIIEQCGTRFTESQVQEMLETIKEILFKPTESQDNETS